MSKIKDILPSEIARSELTSFRKAIEEIRKEKGIVDTNCGSCIHWHGKEFHWGRYARCNKLSYLAKMGNEARKDDPAYICAITEGRYNLQTDVYFEAREDFCCSMWKESK